MGKLVLLAYSLYRLPFNKEEEFAADQVGLKMAMNAGYRKAKALAFFDKLSQVEKQEGSVPNNQFIEFIRSHPPTELRKKRLL